MQHLLEKTHTHSKNFIATTQIGQQVHNNIAMTTSGHDAMTSLHSLLMLALLVLTLQAIHHRDTVSAQRQSCPRLFGWNEWIQGAFSASKWIISRQAICVIHYW